MASPLEWSAEVTPYSADQMYTITIAERVSSVLSLIGTTIIILTFILDSNFHKPINRMVFYAAWGNIASNIGTLISTDGLRLGVNGPLCQFQAMMVQWFILTDALWTFAMALNVYLTFFRKYDAKQLRTLEWKYILFCYGVPFVPAFAYLFISSPSKGKMYGSAAIWCWVSLKWDPIRIATFYGPAWLVIFMTFIIYLWCGRVVFQWRRKLLEYAQHQRTQRRAHDSVHDGGSSITKTTHVLIEREGTELSERHLQPGSAGLPYSDPRSPTQPLSPRSLVDSRNSTSGPQSSTQAMDGNRAALSYCKCALLFFVALLCTWVPSTVNRLYTVVNPKAVNFALSFVASVVLPLQGFWNTLIYVVTSLPAFKALFLRLLSREPKHPAHYPPVAHNFSYPSTRAVSKRTSQQWPLKGRTENWEEIGGDPSPRR